MTPGARVAAAIAVLDANGAGQSLEKALTNWARQNRYAGSKDRAAVRDLVFDVVRQKMSCAAFGGGSDGRALLIGLCRKNSFELDDLFSGKGYAPQPLSDHEKAHVVPEVLDEDAQFDWPIWLLPALNYLGEHKSDVMKAMQSRAPVFVRVNTAKCSVQQAQQVLANDNISAMPHPLAKNALEVTQNARRLRNSQAYQSGQVELQDAASQAVVEHLGIRPGMRILDFCAGGGGKTLAIAAQSGTTIVAHDGNPGRMKDLPARAKRAGAKVEICDSRAKISGKFDLVLCDVPCSGSGSWRRDPEGKWSLTLERLEELTELQREIAHVASDFVQPGGQLAYATCSLLPVENDDAIDHFLAAHPDFSFVSKRQFTPLDGGDGFFVATLTRVAPQ